MQVLALCQRAGLVGLGHVAVDGTKLRANASKHKAMSYARMVRAEAELAAQPPGTPELTAQRNFTDPDSRIMLGRDGFVQAYNGQAAVDAGNQVIVAHRLTANASDQDGLLPLVDATAANTGCQPAEVSADNGFCSEANLAGLAERKVRGYVATGRAKHPANSTGRGGGPLTAAMRRRIRRRAPQPLPAAQARRRARVRPDQGRPRLPATPVPRHRAGPTRVGAALHRPQPRQAHIIEGGRSPAAPLLTPAPRQQTRYRDALLS